MLTPDPRGYPRTSPTHSCVPSKPLTDRRIHILCLKGWYGSTHQRFSQAIENGKKLLKDKKIQRQKQIQQTIEDLIK